MSLNAYFLVRSGVHILDRKYLNERTPFCYVSLRWMYRLFPTCVMQKRIHVVIHSEKLVPFLQSGTLLSCHHKCRTTCPSFIQSYKVGEWACILGDERYMLTPLLFCRLKGSSAILHGHSASHY